MPGRPELAAEEPEGLLSISESRIDALICAVLAGRSMAWDNQGRIDHSRFIDRARYHGVSGLLHHQLEASTESAQWPREIRTQLELAAKAGVAQDLLRDHHLQQFMDLLRAQSIDGLLIKGEALSRSCYPLPGTRARSDIDIFIRPGDVMAVRHLAEAMGYEVCGPLYTSRQFTLMRPNDASRGIRFDVHWRISNHPRFARMLTFDEALKESVPVPGLEATHTLCGPHALLLACAHRVASENQYPDRLIWIVDIDRLLSTMRDAEVDLFVERAVWSGLADVCLAGIRRAVDCLDTKFPASALAKLQDGAQSAEPNTARGVAFRMGSSWDDLRALGDWRARGGYVVELLAPPTGSMLVRYGKRNRLWLPLLYLRRVLEGLSGRSRADS